MIYKYILIVAKIFQQLLYLMKNTQQPPAKAGGLNIGGLSRRLKQKTTKSRWFLPRLPHIRVG